MAEFLFSLNKKGFFYTSMFLHRFTANSGTSSMASQLAAAQTFSAALRRQAASAVAAGSPSNQAANPLDVAAAAAAAAVAASAVPSVPDLQGAASRVLPDIPFMEATNAAPSAQQVQCHYEGGRGQKRPKNDGCPLYKPPYTEATFWERMFQTQWRAFYG